jgi:hypothetical protein
VHDYRNARRSEKHGDHREARDRRPVVLQVPERCVVRGIEENRRDEEGERELRWNGDRRRAGNEREQRAAQREEYRIRRADAPRRRCEGDRGAEKKEDLLERADGAL